MNDTLFNLTLKLAKKLGTVRSQAATGGSTTTLIDTEHLIEADDVWNEGTIWIERDAAGAGAAPEGEYSGIADFTQSTGLADLHETLSAAIAVGDRYSIATPRYPIYDLVSLINEALESLSVSFSDTSLTTVSGETEIALPNVGLNFELRQVWEQRRTGASNDNQWVKRVDWDIQRTATGSPDKLIFMTAAVGNRSLKLDYVDAHPALYVASDQLRENVHPDLVVTKAAIVAVEKRIQDPNDNDPNLTRMIERFDGQAQIIDAEKPIQNPPKNTKRLVLNMTRSNRYPGDNQPR